MTTVYKDTLTPASHATSTTPNVATQIDGWNITTSTSVSTKSYIYSLVESDGNGTIAIKSSGTTLGSWISYPPVVSSSSNGPALAAETSSVINVNQANDNSTSNNDDNGDQHGSGLPGFAKVVIGVVLVMFALAFGMTCLFCIRKRKARRAHIQWIRENEKPSDGSGISPIGDSGSRAFGGDLTRDELFEVIPLPLPTAAASSQSSQRPILPRIQTETAIPLVQARRGIRPISTVGSESRWSDNSEMDAFATDGSSIARTLSTHSVASSRGSSSTITENPFNHPAYTLSSGRSRRGPRTGTGTGTGTYTPTNTSPAGTWTNDTKVNPFVDNPYPPSGTTSSSTWASYPAATTSSRSNGNGTSSLSPATPNSATGLMLPSPQNALAPSLQSVQSSGSRYSQPSPTDTDAQSRAPTERSWTTEDDLFLGTSTRDLDRARTVVQHRDAEMAREGTVGGGEAAERRRRGEIHLPPTYNELYPSMGR